jgi:hypothetical protein
MPDADVPATGVTFRYSRLTPVIVAALLVAGLVALLDRGRTHANPFAYYLAALLFAFLWIYQSMLVARMRSTNWLVRVAEQGIYIKFRSYLNHHFPASEATAVFIPFRDVRLTRLIRERQTLMDSDGRGARSQRRTIVEIELKRDAPEIDEALAAERRAGAPRVARWYGSSAGKFRHHPVRMSTPRTIALEWGVVPRAKHFLAIMAVHAPVESAKVVRDYTALGALARHEQESRLLELAEHGQVMDAVRLARSLYGYDLAEAKLFVESLSSRARS